MRVTTSRRLAPLALALLAGGAHAELNCNAGVEFHAKGGVHRCVLNGDHRIYVERGVAVTCADGRVLEQHPDGTLARCTLKADARIGEHDCAAGAEATFGVDGRLLSCTAARSG